MKIAIYHNLTSGGAKRALYETARRLIGRHELQGFSLVTANQRLEICAASPSA